MLARVSRDSFRRGCVVSIAGGDYEDSRGCIPQYVHHVLLFGARSDANGRIPEPEWIASFGEKVQFGIVGQYEDRFVRL